MLLTTTSHSRWQNYADTKIDLRNPAKCKDLAEKNFAKSANPGRFRQHPRGAGYQIPIRVVRG
jgi:hypothetical protein